MNNVIGKSIEYLYQLWNDIKAKSHTYLLSTFFCRIGRKSTIIPPFRFANLSMMHIGNNVTIHSNCWIQILRNNNHDMLQKLIIKDNVSIGMNATISVAKKVIIENNVITARNVYISDHEHEFRNIDIPISHQGITKIAEVRIGADTWIGQNAVILPGVTIGRHCVIGANSVVNETIPDYSVAVGAPAKIVHKYNHKTGNWD